MLLAILGVPSAAATQGNGDAARACREDGYLAYGGAFSNVGDCVRYALLAEPTVTISDQSILGYTLSVSDFYSDSGITIYSSAGGYITAVTDVSGAFPHASPVSAARSRQ